MIVTLQLATVFLALLELQMHDACHDHVAFAPCISFARLGLLNLAMACEGIPAGHLIVSQSVFFALVVVSCLTPARVAAVAWYLCSPPQQQLWSSAPV